MVAQKCPASVFESSKDHRRQQAEEPAQLRYEGDDADSYNINPILRKECRVEYTGDEDIDKIGNQCVQQQYGAAFGLLRAEVKDLTEVRSEEVITNSG